MFIEWAIVRISVLHEGFAEEVDDLVALFGAELLHGGHESSAVCQSAEHFVGVGAVFEGLGAEGAGSGEGRCIAVGAVAGFALVLVDLFAGFEVFGVEGAKDAGVVEVDKIVADDERLGIGLEFLGARGSAASDFDDIADEVVEVAIAGKGIGESIGHHGFFGDLARFDIGFGDPHFLFEILGIAEKEFVRGFGGDETGDEFTVGGDNRKSLEAFTNGLGGVENGLDDLKLGGFLRDGDERRTEGRDGLVAGVATSASGGGHVEEDGSTLWVSFPFRLGGDVGCVTSGRVLRHDGSENVGKKKPRRERDEGSQRGRKLHGGWIRRWSRWCYNAKGMCLQIERLVGGLIVVERWIAEVVVMS